MTTSPRFSTAPMVSEALISGVKSGRLWASIGVGTHDIDIAARHILDRTAIGQLPRRGEFVIIDFKRRIVSRLQGRDPCRIDVKRHHGHGLPKGDGQRQANIAQPDNSQSRALKRQIKHTCLSNKPVNPAAPATPFVSVAPAATANRLWNRPAHVNAPATRPAAHQTPSPPNLRPPPPRPPPSGPPPRLLPPPRPAPQRTNPGRGQISPALLDLDLERLIFRH